MPVLYAFKVVFLVAVSAVALISVIGNSLVIFSFIITQNLRKSTNYYITSMAVSDLLYVATTLALYASSRLYVLGGFVSSFHCKLGKYLTKVSYAVSVESLVLISVDRFIATVFPIKATMITGRIRAVFISLTWIIPIGILAPYLSFTRRVQETDGLPYLCTTKALSTVYMILGFLLLYLIPLIVIIILNTRIMKSLARTNSAIQGNVDSSTTRRKQNQQIMKVIISITSAFFICWTLFYFSRFFTDFIQNVFKKRYMQEMFVIVCNYSFALVSTAFSPVILFTFSTNYRQALKNCVCLAIDKCCSCFTGQENIELPDVCVK